MKGTITTQSQRKAFGSRELSNQTTPAERTASRSAPEPSDNDARSALIRGASILRAALGSLRLELISKWSAAHTCQLADSIRAISRESAVQNQMILQWDAGALAARTSQTPIDYAGPGSLKRK